MKKNISIITCILVILSSIFSETGINRYIKKIPDSENYSYDFSGYSRKNFVLPDLSNYKKVNKLNLDNVKNSNLSNLTKSHVTQIEFNNLDLRTVMLPKVCDKITSLCLLKNTNLTDDFFSHFPNLVELIICDVNFSSFIDLSKNQKLKMIKIYPFDNYDSIQKTIAKLEKKYPDKKFELVKEENAEFPLPSELAQFAFDIRNNNVEAVKKAIEKYPNIINIGVEVLGLGTVFPVHTYVLTSSNLEIGELVCNESTVNYLLDLQGWSPLAMFFFENSDINVLKLLLEKGADVTYCNPKDNSNIFHYYIIKSMDKRMWEVLKEYADSELLNSQDDMGFTPLMYLIAYTFKDNAFDKEDSIYLLKELISHGANPNKLALLYDYAKEVAKVLKDSKYIKYRKVLLDGMKNNPPVGDSEKLIELLEE